MTELMQARQLVKSFGKLTAVDGVSFVLEKGRCFGLLGPNGAGKTTTIELLEGIKTPDSGEVLYNGKALGKTFRDEAGIMFQNTALQHFVTVREMLVQFSRFYRDTVPIEQLIKDYALEEFLNQDTRKISGGQKQRLLLAMALINRPKIVFLDEPTTGLDPQSRRNMWDKMNAVKKAGTTILLTTHYMEEAYELCDYIAIMDHGKIIAEGAPDQLLAKHFDDVVVQLKRAELPGEEKMQDFAIDYRDDNAHIQTNDVNRTIEQLLALNIPLSSLRIRERNLEDLFLELTGKALRQ